MTTPDTKLPIVAWFQDSGTLGGQSHYEQVHAQFAGSSGTFPLVRAEDAQATIDALTEELRLSRMTEAAAWLRVTEMQSEIDRLRAENFKLSAAMCPLGFGDEGGTPRCCAEAELAALRKDAERYRHLREQRWDTADLFVIAGTKSAVRLGTDCPSHGRLDAAIDDAIASKQDAKP